MADLRTLETVVSRQTAAGGQVLLVGDHHQLPEVGAGGGFEYAALHAPTVAELRVNRRQYHAWEREALADLRAGNVAAAVSGHLGHDRVVTAETPAAMIATAVDMWFDAHERGERPVLLAGTNEIVAALNQAVLERSTSTQRPASTAPGRSGPVSGSCFGATAPTNARRTARRCSS
jgi:ATP-dependent exoDNAse (exonuclease V) alpha subunit